MTEMGAHTGRGRCSRSAELVKRECASVVFSTSRDAAATGDGEFTRMTCVKEPLNLPACNPPRCSNGSPDRRSARGSCASG